MGQRVGYYLYKISLLLKVSWVILDLLDNLAWLTFPLMYFLFLLPDWYTILLVLHGHALSVNWSIDSPVSRSMTNEHRLGLAINRNLDFAWIWNECIASFEIHFWEWLVLVHQSIGILSYPNPSPPPFPTINLLASYFQCRSQTYFICHALQCSGLLTSSLWPRPPNICISLLFFIWSMLLDNLKFYISQTVLLWIKVISWIAFMV